MDRETRHRGRDYGWMNGMWPVPSVSEKTQTYVLRMTVLKKWNTAKAIWTAPQEHERGTKRRKKNTRYWHIRETRITAVPSVSRSDVLFWRQTRLVLPLDHKTKQTQNTAEPRATNTFYTNERPPPTLLFRWFIFSQWYKTKTETNHFKSNHIKPNQHKSRQAKPSQTSHQIQQNRASQIQRVGWAPPTSASLPRVLSTKYRSFLCFHCFLPRTAKK